MNYGIEKIDVKQIPQSSAINKIVFISLTREEFEDIIIRGFYTKEYYRAFVDFEDCSLIINNPFYILLNLNSLQSSDYTKVEFVEFNENLQFNQKYKEDSEEYLIKYNKLISKNITAYIVYNTKDRTDEDE